MVGLESAVYFLANQTLAVYVFGHRAVCVLHQKHTEFGIGAVGIGGILVRAKVADSHIFCVVGVGMGTRGNKPVCGIVGAGKGTVRQHIAVQVIAYRIAAPRNQTVVGIIQEAAVGGRGYVACCIVGKHLLCQNIVVRILDGSLDDTIQAIITITEFGDFVKAFFCDDFRQYLCLFFFLRKILYLTG